MGLFGVKKNNEEKKDDGVYFNNSISTTNTFKYDENSNVLGPQPDILETNIQSQNNTYTANNVAPLGVSAPNNINDSKISTIKPSTNLNNSTIPNVNTSSKNINNNVILKENVEVLNVPVSNPNQNVKMDALNNSTNPVPVNPVAPKNEITNYADVEVNYKNVFQLVVNSLTKPGTTMVEEGNKYRDSMVALKVTLYITLFALVVRLITGMVCGCFSTGYNLSTGASYSTFDPNNLSNVNWLSLIVSSLMVSGVSIAIVSGVYFGFSFIRSKGIAFGRYLMVTNIGFVPLIVGLTILYPLGNIVSSFLGLCLLGVSLIYTLVSFISGINNLLSIESVNRNIIYNVINLGSIFVVIMIILYNVFYSDIINAINLIH